MPSRRPTIPALLSGILSLLILQACTQGDAVGSDGNADGRLRIGDVQGRGDESPYVGQSVTVTGIVTGDFQDNDARDAGDLGGYYLQDEQPDDDLRTSAGIFVFADGRGPDVEAGERVEVTGEVTEFFGETQISARNTRVLGEGVVNPLSLSLPTEALTENSDGEPIADLEHYEGMLVTLEQPLYVSESRELPTFGTLLLHAGERARQFTNIERPSARGYAEHRRAVARNSLILDDGQRSRNVSPVRYLFAHETSGDRTPIRVGDRVVGATGVLRYSRGSGGGGPETWRLMPVREPQFEASNPRTNNLPDKNGALRIMSLNALNYFASIDNGNARCGPAGNQGCRGADSAEELERQRGKLVAAIAESEADIVGLVEIENDRSASLQSLVDALNARLSGDPWRYVATGTIGSDVIKVGLIYNANETRPEGQFAILDSRVDDDFNDDRNRPALAQTFAAGKARITVAVNHLKSKGSDCNDLNDPNRDDGQGNCNRTRTRAAAVLARWLDGDPTGSGSADSLIIGDLNAYLREDPIVALQDEGYVNLLERFVGDDAYSFVFRGQSGALDHALASPSLAAKVISAAEWHINADEPRMLDYNLEDGGRADLFEPDTPFRSSDHDPIIVDVRRESP